MTLTAKQIKDLNKMNVAAQHVNLGTLVLGAGGEGGVYQITAADITSGSVLIPFSGSAIDRAKVVIGRQDVDVTGYTASPSGSILTITGSVLEAGDEIYYYMN